MSQQDARNLVFNPTQVEALNSFVRAIETSRTELIQREICEERTYKYALMRIYSKAILTSCEVYTLLKSGYPEGAFALARSLYEAVIIVQFLMNGYSQSDNELIERFFDAAEIAHIQQKLETVQWVAEHDKEDEQAKKLCAQFQQDIEMYKAKHDVKRFNDYWWAKANSFNDLIQKSGFEKDYLYKEACNNVHFNSYGAFFYIDMEDGYVRIGETPNGIEQPLWYATLCFFVISDLIHIGFPHLISDNALTSAKYAHDLSSSAKRQYFLKQVTKLQTK